MHDGLKILTNAYEKEEHPPPLLHENNSHKPQVSDLLFGGHSGNDFTEGQ